MSDLTLEANAYHLGLNESYSLNSLRWVIKGII